MSDVQAKFCSVCSMPLRKGFEAFKGYHTRCQSKFCNLCGKEISEGSFSINNLTVCSNTCYENHQK